jgi:hypothetical protein
MCGATLLASAAPAGAPVAPTPPLRPVQASPTLSRPIPASVPSRPAPSAPPAAEHHEPTISGPSFLGLNQPAPHSAPRSGNLNYLLEDEEEPQRGGAGKYVLIFVALILAAGLGYLRWKGQGFGWLGSAPNANSGTPAASAPASGTTPANGADPTNPSSAHSSAPPSSSGSAASPPAADSSAAAAPASTRTPAASDSRALASAAPAKAAPDASADSGDDSSATADQPNDQPKPARGNSKPAAAIKPTTPYDPVADAQKYIYGKGVPQNCDRGLRMLKPQAEHANPKAMIEMGALYSAGLCTPRDLPTAYRWFAMALRKDPNNQAVQTDLEKLWGEMTQPERQLAMKLSQ